LNIIGLFIHILIHYNDIKYHDGILDKPCKQEEKGNDESAPEQDLPSHSEETPSMKKPTEHL